MTIYKSRKLFLNTTERRIIKNGDFLDVTPKAFDVLQLLIEKKGEIVTKDDILGKVWNGSFVEEGNLPVHISKLRRTIGETKTEPFIETVQGVGYRYIAPVKSVGEEEWENQYENKNNSEFSYTEKNKLLDSIAVLPLKNESNNLEIEYLTDGITESFINSLSHNPDLKVIARNTVFRYKNQDIDPKDIGETLGVKVVLTGRIRLIDDNLFISVELTNVKEGTQIWGTQFNQSFTKIIDVQEKIIKDVSEKLILDVNDVVGFSKNEFITNNAESYRLYLKGKYLMQKRTPENLYKAISCFDKSVSFDLINVHPYVEMIECYLSLYFSDYISRTVAINKITPLIHIISELKINVDVVQTMLGEFKMKIEWDLMEAEKHFQNALKINPKCLIAHFRYSDFLVITSRYNEAIRVLKNLISFDPISLATYKQIGKLFYKMGRFEMALTYLMDALELEPKDYVTLAIIGATQLELNMFEESLQNFELSLSVQFNIETLSMIGCVYGRTKNWKGAKQIIGKIETLSTNMSRNSLKLSRIYMEIDNKAKANSLFEQAILEHEVDLISIKSDPRFHPFIKEKPFNDLVSMLNL